MDTGEYETNALVISSISCVAFACYEPSNLASTSSFDPGQIESSLRKDSCLPYLDTARRRLWYLRLIRKDDPSPDTTAFPKVVETAGPTFSLVEESNFEPSALVRSRAPAPGASGLSATADPTSWNPQPTTPSTVDADSRTLSPADPKNTGPTPVKEAYQALISAVQSAVSFGLCARTGALPLNSRTLLLHKLSQTASVLATIRVYLTSNGTLVTCLSLSIVDGLVSLSESVVQQLPSLETTVLAAPLGIFATCQAISPIDQSTLGGGTVFSPDTQVVKSRSDRSGGPSRSICSRLLQARGISIPINSSQWLGLQRLRRRPIDPRSEGMRTPIIGSLSSVSWPSCLCFCKAFSRLTLVPDASDKSWSNLEKNYDPLTLAKEWFMGAAERDDIIDRRRRDREAAAAAAVDTSQPVTQPQPQPQNALSPLDLQRSGNPAVTSGSGAVYPTPPDGVLNNTGVTPSIDGTVSSPGIQVAPVAAADIDMVTAPPPVDPNWDEPDRRRDRASGSFDAENLFGDMGPDMFGDTDITEADFNFFDEQPGGMDLSSLDVPVLPDGDPMLGLPVDVGVPQEDPAPVPVPMEEPVPDMTAPAPVLPAPVSPVFTKPELRDARSSLAEEARKQTEPEKGRQISSSIKRQASPFTPDTVFKRIKASLDSRRPIQTNSLTSSSEFDKVNFGPSLSLVDRKYGGSGRYDFSQDRVKAPQRSESDGTPTTDYLRRHSQGLKHMGGLPSRLGEVFARASEAQNASSDRPSPSDLGDHPSDADELSLVSDQDDDSYESDEPTSPVKSTGIRRKRVDDDGESLATSFKDLECADATSPNIPVDLPRITKSDIELPLTRYFADPEPDPVQFPLQDEDFIMAAQILTEQCVSTTLPIPCRTQMSIQSEAERRRELLNMTRNSMLELHSVLNEHVGPVNGCQFRSLVEVQDYAVAAPVQRLQPKTNSGASQMPMNPLFQIPSPHLELRRYESTLSVLPSAVGFWESLGLAPARGPKDINAICIFPNFAGLADEMLVFTDRIRSIYESLKLGSFNRLDAGNDFENGMLPFEVEKTIEPFREASSIIGPSLRDGINRLCKALTTLTVKQTNLVVFFVYSPDTSGSMVESCVAFRQLFEGYKKSLASRKLPPVNELALQLLPLDFVASPDSLATPSPSDFGRLAIETYDRCTLFGGAMPSPAIMLEQAPPRIITFKLSLNPSASPLHEDSNVHVAYSQSVDERWVTAAWTDIRGNQQMTASYCRGRKGKPIATPMVDVAREIWETTRDFISVWKVHWRVVIVKCGALEPHEIDMWTSVSQSESIGSTSLTIMAVDTDPSLQLVPPPPKIPVTAASTFYTTPVSTPQASIVSPEQSGNPTTPMRDYTATGAPTPGGDAASAATPAAENEADATLTDVCDQTWGAILAHRLTSHTNFAPLTTSSSPSPHSSGDPQPPSSATPSASSSSAPNNIPASSLHQTPNTTSITTPALASGYLVKRGGPRPEDPPAVMEVNLAYHDGPGPITNNPPRSYDNILREMLKDYRGLGTLARARAVVDRNTDVRPWHVAAAEKGARALYLLM